MGSYVGKGEFDRDTNYITTRITADARDGYPGEAGRYRLVVARACPWANRAIIVRRYTEINNGVYTHQTHTFARPDNPPQDI